MLLIYIYSKNKIFKILTFKKKRRKNLFGSYCKYKCMNAPV